MANDNGNGEWLENTNRKDALSHTVLITPTVHRFTIININLQIQNIISIFAAADTANSILNLCNGHHINPNPKHGPWTDCKIYNNEEDR